MRTKNAKQCIWWLWEISNLKTISFQCLGVNPAYTSSYRQDELQENGVIKWKHSKKNWKQLSLSSFSSLLGLLIWSLQHFKFINLPTLWNITLTLGISNHIFIPLNKQSHLLMSWESQHLSMLLEYYPK